MRLVDFNIDKFVGYRVRIVTTYNVNDYNSKTTYFGKIVKHTTEMITILGQEGEYGIKKELIRDIRLDIL